MDNLSKVIKALFIKINGDDILEKAGFYHKDNKSNAEISHLDSEIQESELINKLLQVDNDSTIDQLSMLGQTVQFKWMASDDSCISMKFHKSDSIYNILLHFSSKCLIEKDSVPLCRYKDLLKWHMLTTLIGEDLLTVAFLASKDSHLNKERKNFDWNAFIGHTCKELNQLFEKPMVELHMHLKGSSYNVDLSWICMMNHIGIMQKCFEEKHSYQKFKTPDKKLYEKMKRAAAIRYYLAGAVGCIPQDYTSSQLNFDLKNGNREELKDKDKGLYDELKKNCLQDYINKRRKRAQELSKEQFNILKEKQHFEDELKEEDVVDYIQVSHYGKEPIENKVLGSERKFMYSVFKVIYEDDKNERSDIATLFYAYLAYKNYFRNEVLQLNERVGFANFASYEERKTDYMLDTYDHLLYKAAIEGFLEKGKGKKEKDKRFVEARIVPKNTVEEIESTLEYISKKIAKTHEDHYDFIFHFIKKRDEPKYGKKYRHFSLRKEIREQAYAIYNFRYDNHEKHQLIGKVVGLDAANSEIYCRPEVYAQAFRFLRGHEIKTDDDIDADPNDLNITYHVGEDFMDIADGLRAVEEALIFLNLRNGDRLGHALVLGTNVSTYYKKRDFSVCVSTQVLIDNLAWLHHKCIRLVGYTPLCGWLEIMFLKYFNEIYISKQKKGQDIIASFFNENDDDYLSYNIDDYYLSWLLRGNSPTIGTELDTKNLKKLNSTIDKQWAYAGMNHHLCAETALKNSNARQLFDAYHSFKYADRGYKADTLTIPLEYQEEWITLLEKIQQNLLDKIETKHIAIECNPSSNFKIGEMERYDEHPIVKFFNYGLSTPYPRHDIAVSINTDDQGVFSTSLEREYSLIALAIERNQTEEHHNSPRAIMDWLDRIREISIEQKFKYES